MRTSLVTVVVFLCICHGRAFAGNQGYVYGTAPKADDSAASGNNPASHNPIKDIADAIHKMDDWTEKYLW